MIYRTTKTLYTMTSLTKVYLRYIVEIERLVEGPYLYITWYSVVIS